MQLEFSVQIFEKYSYFMKIRPVEAELFYGDAYIYIYKYIYIHNRQTERDMTKVAVAFRNFANSPKNTPSCIIPSEEY